MENNNNSQQEIVLTQSQQHAFDKFKEFIDSDKKVFILKGYAGTGKTTLLKFFVVELQKQKKKFELLASTGRAAKIMRDKIGLGANTIHGAIYRYKDLNKDLDELFKGDKEPPKVDSTGQLFLTFEVVAIPDELQTECIYIVDEASMVGDKKDETPNQAIYGTGRLLNDLININHSGKYIFVGDNCQLPPVKGDISPALSLSYIKEKHNIEGVAVQLTEIKRQTNDNDIVLAAQEFRLLYENPPQIEWPSFPLCGFKNITILSSREELINKYIEDVRINGYSHSTLLCYSNGNSLKLARQLRQKLHKFSEPLCVNDLLLITQNNYPTGLMNGDLVKVLAINGLEIVRGMTFARVEVEEINTKSVYNHLLIMDVLNSGYTNILPHQHKDLIIDFYFRMKKLSFSQKSIEFKINMKEDPYLNAFRAVYGYAITCHKSQGGEWENVYLDIPHAFSHNAREQEYQWLYTAITRARGQLFIVQDFHLSYKDGLRPFSQFTRHNSPGNNSGYNIVKSL